jgi:fatty-acyl-CoA synthase
VAGAARVVLCILCCTELRCTRVNCVSDFVQALQCSIYLSSPVQARVILMLSSAPCVCAVACCCPHPTPVLLLLLYPCRQHMPDHAAAAELSVPVLCYEQLLDEAAESGALGTFSWPRLHEDSPAGLCYTSGTTGNPKVGRRL